MQNSKGFHEEAERFLQKLISDSERALRLQAINLADQLNDEVVLRKHVGRAWDIVMRREQEQNQLKEWAKTIGGILLGIFGSGFIAELATGPTVWIGAYTLLGFVGVILVAFGYWTESNNK